jgi:uncharacterized protein (DUF302 family)
MDRTTTELSVQLNTNMLTAEEKVKAALQQQGFGILTQIDMQTTLKNKLDVDFPPYKILGACNPSLAHRALNATPEAGLLLPCNVTLSEENAGTVRVSIIDPLVMLGIMETDALDPIAQDAYERLVAVIESLQE